MAAEEDSPLDLLWNEYGSVFRDFDDVTLARWLAQTLGQFEGKAWRMTHPLVRTYQLAAQAGQKRHIWLKRLVTAPAAYPEASCCRAPLLPLLTRDVHEAGLICPHCSETAVALEDIPEAIRTELRGWATDYAQVHGVAHWDDRQRKRVPDYDRAFETAAEQAELMLRQVGHHVAPKLLEFYPAVIWEDQDECLEVRPEDVIA